MIIRVVLHRIISGADYIIDVRVSIKGWEKEIYSENKALLTMMYFQGVK